MPLDQASTHSYDAALLWGLISVCVLFFFVSMLHHYARKSPLPYESWLVIVGVLYANARAFIFPGLPDFVLDPDIVILVILPVLIFSSGRSLHIDMLLKERWSIAYLAVFGVVFSAAAIGLPLAWLLGLPWSHGLMFGAAIAATDPSAVSVIFKRFPIPERLAMIVEGESLFNDGVAIVLFTLLSMIVLADIELNPGGVLLYLLWSVFGAIPVGWVFGLLMGRLVHHWREQNQFVGLSLSLLLAYGTFMLAEVGLHASGVIAVLCAALAFVKTRWGSGSISKANHTELFQSFWAYLNTMASSVLFFTLGVAVGTHAFFWSWAFPAVISILLLSRAMLVYGGALLKSRRQHLALGWRHVLMLGGLRGAVSAALVQMIPIDYQYRIIFLCIVFVVIMFTLVLQPVLLKAYLRNHPL